MSIAVNQEECTGCRNCIAICPGNIIRLNTSGKAYLKRPSDCWSCMSCVKECTSGAISLILPPELGGRGGRLAAKVQGSLTEWTITKADGTRKVLITNTEEANTY